MPWKGDLKASPQKVILGDGRRSNKSTQNPGLSHKKGGVEAEVLTNPGLSTKQKNNIDKHI